jgi:hypothetical protein
MNPGAVRFCALQVQYKLRSRPPKILPKGSKNLIIEPVMSMAKSLLLSGKILAVTILLLVTSGCLSQKPLPYAAVSRNVVPTGPRLQVLPVEDKRLAKDELDKLLEIPKCVEQALVAEMEGVGLFQSVANGSPGGTGYTLRVVLEDFRWEVPKYDALVGKAFGISIATGGLGGLIYGSTDTPVLGHTTMLVVLSSPQSELINKRYVGRVEEERAKLNCDTASTRREMAAKGLADAIRQFKADVLQVEELKRRSVARLSRE